MTGTRYTAGDADERPWGNWRVVDAGDGFAVKRITVRPGAKLSLQYHRGRDEHWIVVAGRARVTCGDAQLDLGANETVFIQNGVKHRVENIGISELVFIEVQTGTLLDEADIVRIEDDYQRA
ncbi:MAG: phosphomannose isomerase type II C-terminal cupin domain [Acetobacteraceae bacterium]|nr:phosphomannose isomerase type II C-terminal cupin domain [Acetobacteraceae bacterium]